ncbi:unnamed protein product, partial [Protopolystoma xenopodis]
NSVSSPLSLFLSLFLFLSLHHYLSLPPSLSPYLPLHFSLYPRILLFSSCSLSPQISAPSGFRKLLASSDARPIGLASPRLGQRRTARFVAERQKARAKARARVANFVADPLVVLGLGRLSSTHGQSGQRHADSLQSRLEGTQPHVLPKSARRTRLSVCMSLFLSLSVCPYVQLHVCMFADGCSNRRKVGRLK